MRQQAPEIPFKTVHDIDLDGQQVLLRADFNVPMDENGVSDNERIAATIPTITHLLERDTSIVIHAHLGRPKDAFDESHSLRPVATRLSELLDRDIQFLPDAIGEDTRKATSTLRKGSIALAENIRFFHGETATGAAANKFALELAHDSAAQVMVQDAFGSIHNKHASMVALPNFLPAVGGLLVASEYEQLTQATQDPEGPLHVIVGGVKISDRIPLLERYVDIADRIILGIGPANAFLRYRGYDIGTSIVEKDVDPIVEYIYERARRRVGDKQLDDFIVLPSDVAYGDINELPDERQECHIADLPAKAGAHDLGYNSVQRAIELIGNQGTVICNGLAGWFDIPQFAYGSTEIIRHIANSASTSIVDGGDASSVVRNDLPEIADKIDHISTGGQACLRLLSGETLPGITALLQREGVAK